MRVIEVTIITSIGSDQSGAYDQQCHVNSWVFTLFCFFFCFYFHFRGLGVKSPSPSEAVHSFDMVEPMLLALW
jgi:hypothetical protein